MATKKKKAPRAPRNLVVLGMITRGGNGAHKNKRDGNRQRGREENRGRRWEEWIP